MVNHSDDEEAGSRQESQILAAPPQQAPVQLSQQTPRQIRPKSASQLPLQPHGAGQPQYITVNDTKFHQMLNIHRENKIPKLVINIYILVFIFYIFPINYTNNSRT